ncbi:LysR family transcriptional regulator [Deinococcus sp.]|uniref:LysR family transcriptional regulator n=1 Tax=Deinococcus sp. TaxID=47478 RepID=UPI0025D069F3|nr:LysR family transcriptional regulator [Deinococcus sp.]
MPRPNPALRSRSRSGPAPKLPARLPFLTLSQLRLFVAVAEEGSFSAAAAGLGMSQSSLSEGVRALEVALGQELLIRSRVGVSLSAAGSRVIGYARDALLAVQDLQLAANPAAALSGQLTVATYRSIGQHLLAPALGRLHTQHPALHIRVLDAGRDGEGGVRFVTSGEADVGLIEQPEGSGLLFEVLLRDSYLVVLPALAAPHGAPPAWSDLKAQPLLIPSLTSGPYGRVLDFMRSQGGLGPQVSEIDEDDVILSMVEYGLGYTVFPRLALRGLRDTLVALPLPPSQNGQHLERVIGLAIRPGRAGLPHVRALAEAVREQLGR